MSTAVMSELTKKTVETGKKFERAEKHRKECLDRFTRKVDKGEYSGRAGLDAKIAAKETERLARELDSLKREAERKARN